MKYLVRCSENGRWKTLERTENPNHAMQMAEILHSKGIPVLVYGDGKLLAWNCLKDGSNGKDTNV